jgi:Uma2 family endonuclease
MGKLLTRRRFTVDDYHRMGETGILSEDNRLELIRGDIVFREPIGAYHAGTVNRLARLFNSRLGDQAIVSVQNPVQFPREDTEVQPDVALFEVRREPLGDRYGSVRILGRGQRVSPDAFPDLSVDVADLVQ